MTSAISTITSFSRHLADQSPDWAVWPSKLPDLAYSYKEVRFKPRGAPLEVGETLHRHFHSYVHEGRIPYQFYFQCVAISDVLRDIGFKVDKLESEQPLRIGSLGGQVDIHGPLCDGRHGVAEIKVTKGSLALEPNAAEVIQVASYAVGLGLDNPCLVVIRVAIGASGLNAFVLQDSAHLIEAVRGELTKFAPAA